MVALGSHESIEIPERPDLIWKIARKELRKELKGFDWAQTRPSVALETHGTRLGRRLRAAMVRQTVRRGDGKETKYALIVNGDDAVRHLRNVARFSRHLMNGERVPEENILVLCSDSCERRFHEATREGFRSAVAHLRERLDADDILFVYTTGHGETAQGVSSLLLEDEVQLPAPEFADAVLELPVERVVYYGDQCYGGGFALALSGERGREVLAMSATDEKHADDCSLFTPAFLDYLAANPPVGRYYQHAYTCARLSAQRKYEEYELGERPVGLYLESPTFPLGVSKR